ncbi:hypothetical protein ASE61_13310 [Bosea sp. Root670]|nr:hypothetical protein ASE61_13310 [Bosea sp. Root670]
MFAAFGVAFAATAARYEIGLPAQMGPGWFPLALGALLTGLGILIAFAACRVSATRTEIAAIAWREMSLILLAVALFALLLPTAGAVIAVVALVAVCAWAGRSGKLIETGLVALTLAAICDFVFIRGLGLPIAAWPSLPFSG